MNFDDKLSFTRTPLTGSAHAPPVKGVRLHYDLPNAQII